MLILNNEEIESLLTVENSLVWLEKAYREQAEGKAVNRPRTDMYLPSTTEGGVYVFKSMEGGLQESKVVALRLNSDVIRWEEQEGRVTKKKDPVAPGGKWVGLILLFSAESGEPLAIFPDGVIQRLRVAISSALAAREMARKDSSVLGLFGAGWQAGAHVPAMCAVRKITKVQVFSPTEARRRSFVQEMEKKVGIPVEAVSRPEEAAHDADILVAATNAITRVIEPEWVRPGIHFTCVKDCELGEETIRKADRVAIHARNFAPENFIAGFGDERIAAHDPLDYLRAPRGGKPARAKPPFWLDAPELKDIIGGKAQGRGSPEEATCFINNIGLGIQFAAVGAGVYGEARAKGIGREIPTDWFLESVHP
ncbi:MAG: ornithine cyclodeaminase family protein [Deltaproteobacteria bacterium]|nr:ornithine cyclodeaminase family protein [Deltaproteobacteria bacterium]